MTQLRPTIEILRRVAIGQGLKQQRSDTLPLKSLKCCLKHLSRAPGDIFDQFNKRLAQSEQVVSAILSGANYDLVCRKSHNGLLYMSALQIRCVGSEEDHWSGLDKGSEPCAEIAFFLLHKPEIFTQPSGKIRGLCARDRDRYIKSDRSKDAQSALC